jgi:hypothetical protein
VDEGVVVLFLRMARVSHSGTDRMTDAYVKALAQYNEDVKRVDSKWLVDAEGVLVVRASFGLGWSIVVDLTS